MANTIIAIRYGERDSPSADRPSVFEFEYPTWTLAESPRARFPYRMQTTQTLVGSYLAPLTEDVATVEIGLVLMERTGATRNLVGNPVATMIALNALRGQPLTLQWGGELDWGDGWYLTTPEYIFEVPAQYPQDVGGSTPRDGGMVFEAIGVRLSFTANMPELSAPVLGQSASVGIP